jgi:methyl-accepting chemotaxis protein
MQFIRDLSVRAKLLGGFGVVLAINAVMGVVLLSELGTINTGSEYLGTKSVPSVQAIGQISRDAVDFRRAQLKYVLAPVGPAKTLAQTQWTTDAAAVQSLLQKTRASFTDARERQLWQSVSSEWSSLQQQTSGLGSISAHVASAPAGVKLIDSSLPTFLALSKNLTAWSNANLAWADKNVKANRSAYSFAHTLGIALLVIAILLGLGIAYAVSRSIKSRIDVVLERLEMLRGKCMSFLREGMEALADGDLTRTYEPVTPLIENPSKDEIGQVATAVNEMREHIVATLGDYNRTAERLRDAIGQVAQTAGSVGNSSNEMASTSEQAGKATGEIAQAVGHVAEGAERQVRMVEEAKRSAEEVARAVAESAENASQAAEVAQEARQVAQEGVNAAAQADEAMSSVRDSSAEVTEAIRLLADKSEQIGAIVQTITGIAEQTNLLALNAAIEAARAGEQGRGFAVVAEEVRKLAEESQAAAQEISGLISAIQDETSKAVNVVEDGARRTQDGAQVVQATREAFLKIGSSVEDMTARIEQIAAVAQQVAASASSMQDSISEVASVAEESSASTEEVSASTEETSASAEQIAASAQELSGNAEELNRLVAKFRVSS